ncbi:MAG: PLP-dependent aminotransferase family protein, partial [Solirubrobacterales bacterium]
LPSYIDTTDLLAKALRENVAFVPGAAAYVDGRGGSDMRLNFSASPPEEIREGIKRIGNVIAEQVQLYESITEHNVPPASSASRPGAAGSAEGRGSVIPFRR